MLHLAFLFVLYQDSGSPDELAPYSPTRGRDLRSSAIRVLSIMKTCAKVSALSPEIFISHNMDRHWLSVYDSVWSLEANKQLAGGVNGLLDPPCIMPLLEMLPTLSMMLNMRGACKLPLDQNSSNADMSSRTSSSVPPAHIAANVLTSITYTIGAFDALAPPRLSLAILTSQPAWEILETVGRSLVPSQEACHSSTWDVNAISLTIFWACLVDRLFFNTTLLQPFWKNIFRSFGNMPSALEEEKDFADFVTGLGMKLVPLIQKLALPYYLQADAITQPNYFVSSFTQAVSTLSPPELFKVTPDEPSPLDPSPGPNDSLDTLDQLSALSHIFSSGIWETLIDYLLMDGATAQCLLVTASLLTTSLYQAVAIVENFLFISSSSISTYRGDRRAVMDASAEQQLLDCRAGIVKALLAFDPLRVEEDPDDSVVDASEAYQPSSVKFSPTPSSDVSWSNVLHLLRSSLLQLRVVLKTFSPFVPRDWELVKEELRLGEPEEVWGTSSCCNTSCARFEGACEVEVKTLTCGGMCGARYCCRDCQEQAWRAGHRKNCGALKEMRDLAQRRKPVQASSQCELLEIYSTFRYHSRPGRFDASYVTQVTISSW